MKIRRLLIANRGEIAVRIIRACREAGLESVAVYSDVDINAAHVGLADRAIRIGPAPPSESYLSIPALIAIPSRIAPRGLPCPRRKRNPTGRNSSTFDSASCGPMRNESRRSSGRARENGFHVSKKITRTM